MSNPILVKPEGYFLNISEEMVAFLPSQIGVVLEIGCGKGGYAAHIKKR